MLWSRIFEPTFYLTFLHMVLSVGGLLAAIVTLVLAVVNQQWIAAGVLSTALIAYWALLTTGYFVVRSGVERAVARRGVQLPVLDWKSIATIVGAAPVCQFAYGVWITRALFARQIKWREVTYQINSSQDIRIIDYQPLVTQGNAPSQVSL